MFKAHDPAASNNWSRRAARLFPGEGERMMDGEIMITIFNYFGGILVGRRRLILKTTSDVQSQQAFELLAVNYFARCKTGIDEPGEYPNRVFGILTCGFDTDFGALSGTQCQDR